MVLNPTTDRYEKPNSKYAAGQTPLHLINWGVAHCKEMALPAGKRVRLMAFEVGLGTCKPVWIGARRTGEGVFAMVPVAKEDALVFRLRTKTTEWTEVRKEKPVCVTLY